MKMKYGEKMSTEIQKCIDACMECYSSCESTMSHCLQQGGRYVEMPVMRALMDCADMTRTCADMVMRRSPMASELAMMTSRICDMGAEAFRSMANDPMMKHCADLCRACSEACQAAAKSKMPV